MQPKELIAYPKITQNYQKFFSTFKITGEGARVTCNRGRLQGARILSLLSIQWRGRNFAASNLQTPVWDTA